MTETVGPLFKRGHMAVLILALLICETGLPAHAQTPTSFPEEDAAFIEAFASYIGKSKRDISYAAATAMTDAYNAMSDDMKSTVQATAAAMLSNKVRNYPVYTDYAEVVTEIFSRQGEVTQEHIVVLKDLIEAARPGGYKQFEDYIEYLPELMDERALYKTATRLWSFAEGASYTPGVEDGRPYIELENTELIAMTKNDTIRIFGTTGRCFPIDKRWQGTGGTLYFTRTGWSEEEVAVELTEYDMAMDKADFEFDSVFFTMPQYLDGKVLGSVKEKLYSTAPNTVTFPRFASKASDLAIKNIDDRVKTSGGFRLEGQKMIISGGPSQRALITFTTDGKRQAEARAARFLIKLDEQEIVAENTEVILFLKKDSIVHPSLLLEFDMTNDALILQRTDGIASNLPYKSQYHQMDMGFNTVKWFLDSSYIDLRTVSTYTSDPVAFTSYEHYIPKGELKYLTLTGRNPLQMIRDLADSYGTMDLHGEEIAGMMGYPLQQIENVLYKLTKDGFIFYDPDTKRVIVDYKTFHYMDAGTGEFDFDHLVLYSDPGGRPSNGTVSIDSQAIIIHGIQPFKLNAIKKVTMDPQGSDVILTEDRDLNMAGKLTAGKLDFKGTGMHFDYDSFRVEMRSVDTLQIWVKGREMDRYGEYPDVRLRSIISDVKGALYVDDPGNKSGLVNYPEYPYFESYDTSYVYFDATYDSTTFPRDKFYFAIYPFTLDSITNTITDSLSFYGKFVSDNIFNPFETFLSVQPDLTLGIDEFTPDEGLAIYQSAGTFFNNYRLRHDGLFGDGRITYRQSELRSGKFEFFPDSMYARLDTFFMTADAETNVPQVSQSRSRAYWLPYSDSMFIEKDGRNFSLYDNKLTYSGQLAYYRGELHGMADTVELARHRLDLGRIQSERSRFFMDRFTADSASLEIYPEESTKPIVSVSGVHVDMNMAEMTGTTETVSDTVITDIPLNHLITDFRKMTWDVDSQKVTFFNNDSLDYFFTSTLPAYDSLQFNAVSAVYDILVNETVADGVNDIPVADSKIIPPDQKLTIEQGGTIEPMSNATLVLNRKDEYHTIVNAELVIRSRNDISGTGSYFYETATGDPYTISIGEITVRPDTIDTPDSRKRGEQVNLDHHITARGIIPEEDFFRLDEQLFYKGNAYLYSDSRDIEFDGYGKLDLKQNEFSSWFNLNQGIDPDSFSLKIDSLIDETRQQVVAGLFISPGELEVYSAVMNPKRSPKDPALLQVEGSLFKGESSGEYLFGKADAVRGSNEAGTVMKYNDNTGEIEIDGAISWVDGIPLVNVAGYGHLEYDPATSQTKAVSSIAIDFPMDESIWYQLPRDIVEYAYDADPIEYERPEIVNMLRHFISNDADAEMVLGDIEAEGMFQIPAGFPYRILLTDVELHWDPVDGNFKSTNTIGISSINRYPVDLQVKAYTEFGYSLGTNYMNLYFEMPSGEWYFFSTKRGKMYVLSSDQSFNDMVVNSDNKEVRTDGKKGDIIYEFQPGNLTSKLTFMQRFDDYMSRISGGGQDSGE